MDFDLRGFHRAVRGKHLLQRAVGNAVGQALPCEELPNASSGTREGGWKDGVSSIKTMARFTRPK
jgi:hypothetical protein